MKRMTLLTAVVLTIFYVVVCWFFKDNLSVTCRDIQLSDKEALVSLINEGTTAVSKVMVVARIYQGDTFVAASPIVEKREVAPSGRIQVRLPLSKTLTKGIDYRVVTHIHTPGSGTISREFQARVIKQTAAWPSKRFFGVIEEPLRLRHCINTIDPRTEMGLL